MRPSDIAGLITRQHQTAGDKLTELALMAETLKTADLASIANTVELTLTLCDELMDHIVIEGKILVPALREVDAWGEDRAEHLIGRLSTRTQKIADLREVCRFDEGSGLGGAVARFIEDRRTAMVRAGLRDLSVLRDDVIGIDCNGG